MSISVAIPVLNEEENIARCLDSLTPQLRNGDEIIIIDNGSTDRTLEIACQYNCKLLLCPGTVGMARSFGVDASSNDVVLEVDGDQAFSEGFLDRHRKYYGDPRVVGVRGRILDYKRRPLANLTYTLGTILLGGHGSYSYRKKTYFQTGGHKNISWGYDVLLWNEIQKHGLTVYDPELIVYHYGKSSDKYVSTPSYLIAASLLGIGGAYEGMIGGALGSALMGAGAGFGLGQLGVDLGINKDAPPNHFHHWMLGLMIIAGTMTFSDVLPEDVEAGLYGLGSGIFVHDILTESTA